MNNDALTIANLTESITILHRQLADIEQINAAKTKQLVKDYKLANHDLTYRLAHVSEENEHLRATLYHVLNMRGIV